MTEGTKAHEREAAPEAASFISGPGRETEHKYRDGQQRYVHHGLTTSA